MKKFMKIGIVVVLFLASSGAGAYFYFDLGEKFFGDGALAEGEEGAEEVVEEVELDPPLYHAMPALIVSANYQGKLRYLQVKLSIMTRNDETLEKLESNTPLIQDALIMLLNEYPFNQLERPEGKETLRSAAEQKVRDVIADEAVESVLFTGFVIQ